MKRFLLIYFFIIAAATRLFSAVGHPFFVNIMPAEYGGHNRNFDILSDDKGRVFVANFEGLMCYDQSKWRMVHAPGIFRITRIFKDRNERIWVGGYNVFGYLSSTKNGELVLKTVFSNKNKGFIGEVTDISEKGGKICVETSIGTAGIEDNAMEAYILEKTPSKSPLLYQGVIVNESKLLPDGTKILATAGKGLVVVGKDGNEKYHITERDGLCNDNVNGFYTDSYGNLWGATDNGVFLVDINTAFTCFKDTDGLLGEVLSIKQKGKNLYVGTLRGLFLKRENAFVRVGEISNACWSLCEDDNGELLASTAEGIYVIQGEKVKQITRSHTITTYPLGNGRYYSGEVDGVFYIVDPQRNKMENMSGYTRNNLGMLVRKVNTIEKATFFTHTADGALWIRNIYGQVFRCVGDYKKLNEILPPVEKKEDERFNHTLLMHNGKVTMVGCYGAFSWDDRKKALVKAEFADFWKKNIRFPQLLYPDYSANCVWATDNEGKNLSLYAQGKGDVTLQNELLRPVHNLNVRSLEVDKNDVWMGGNFGLICWNKSYQDADYLHKATVFIRRVEINGDSVIWGGFNDADALSTKLPFKELTFDSDIREISISFSTNNVSTVGDVEYRWRMNNGQQWSEWTKETEAVISNPRSGQYHFEVMARDRYGRELPSVYIPITVLYPIYLRWYFILFYVIASIVIVIVIVRWRMGRLLKEKMRLEKIVDERTSQIRKQKDEIEEKSQSLEKALNDLSAAQYQLLRQERMATVGTLTKGLVDRILNPMNYVNNFSHMSLGLLKDMKENLEDEEEKMSPDNYDDCLDIIDMLNTNLSKIEQHGVNTTRMLKVMEEMLKDRKCNLANTDVAAILRKYEEMIHSYYNKEISECHMTVESDGLSAPAFADIDAELVSKAVMSMVSNSVYAICKKYAQSPFNPLLKLSLRRDEERKELLIEIHDNGIGIEETILDKVFDPFFTTKPTSEAVGVGLYLSREIIQNHGGEIRVESTKDVETKFIISIPETAAL